VAEVVDGSEAVVGDFVDVEGELGLDVLVFAFGVVDGVAVFGASLGNSMGTARLVAWEWPTVSPM
jgi:hypothetical protein